MWSKSIVMECEISCDGRALRVRVCAMFRVRVEGDIKGYKTLEVRDVRG